MSQCLLVGVDASFSPPTLSALELACQLLEQATAACHLILLHVIPVPVDPTPRWGSSPGSLSYAPPTDAQCLQINQRMQRVRSVLGHCGMPLASIEVIVRAGTPADELVRVAIERNVDLLVLGSRPPSRFSPLHHALLGSITCRVLRLAPCRVLLARPSSPDDDTGLVAWYEQALQLSLQQQTEVLVVFTPAEVAQHFALTDQTIGDREIEAASRALKRFADRGWLLSQVVQGELRYWND